MSIKRTKQRTSGSSRSAGEDTPFRPFRPPEPEKTWEQHTAGRPDGAFAPYSLEAHFANGALLVHAKFGKGVVVDVEGGRIEVLFADGKRKLGHAS